MEFIGHLVFDRAGELGESVRACVLIGKGSAEPGDDVIGGAKALRTAVGGRGRDGLQGAGKGVDRVVEEFKTGIVGGAYAKIHLQRGDSRGEVEGFVEMLESHVKGNVDEILFIGVQRSREIEERVDTESREASSAAGLGNGLSRFSREIGVGSDRGGGSEADEKRGRDSGSDDENEREEGDKEKAASPWVGRSGMVGEVGRCVRGSAARVGFVEPAVSHCGEERIEKQTERKGVKDRGGLRLFRVNIYETREILKGELGGGYSTPCPHCVALFLLKTPFL